MLAAVVLAGCSDDGIDRDGDGRIVESGDVSVFDLQPGDCIVLDESLESAVETLPARPCDEEHNAEVYALVEMDDIDTYPGERELSLRAERECLAQFADYVGVDVADSTLFPTTLIPGIQGWQNDQDRTAVCFTVTAGEMIAHSVRGTGR